MVLYDNLPVYRAGYNLLLDLFKVIGNLPRDYRYTIGEDLRRQLMKILYDIYKANSTEIKADILSDACERMLELKLYVRVLRDLHVISSRSFSHLAEHEEILSRQLTGWWKKQSGGENGDHKRG